MLGEPGASQKFVLFEGRLQPLGLKIQPLSAETEPLGHNHRLKVMAVLISGGVAKSELWRNYQLSFQKFSRSVATIQHLTAQPSINQSEFARAVVDLENARISYNHARDALAAELLESSLPLGPDASQGRQVRTKKIAELLWESAGRPAGTADDDWHRAEQIINRVA